MLPSYLGLVVLYLYVRSLQAASVYMSAYVSYVKSFVRLNRPYDKCLSLASCSGGVSLRGWVCPVKSEFCPFGFLGLPLGSSQAIHELQFHAMGSSTKPEKPFNTIPKQHLKLPYLTVYSSCTLNFRYFLLNPALKEYID